MTQKLQKVLAQLGIGSRREMERWIETGRVNVNHVTAKLGDRVDDHALIEVDGKPITTGLRAAPSSQTVLLYHKPIGELCTRHDPEGRPTVFDHLPVPPSGRWIVIGRLDYNTSGLLLFTNDGELANRLMHPSHHLMRTYMVRVYGHVPDEMLDDLENGVELEDGMARFEQVEQVSGDGRNGWYKVEVAMGKNRIVRRLWESQDVKVNRLIRVGFGNITLPDDLKPGEYLILNSEKIKQLE